jgi:integrase
MTIRKTLSDRGVIALRPRAARYAYPDPELVGHYVRVTPNGSKSFAAVTRGPNGKQVWTTIGLTERLPITEARARARLIIQRVQAGKPAVEPRAQSFGAVVDEWRKRHVDKNGLRSGKEILRLLDRHVLPTWRDRELVAIRRSDIAALLDHVEDEHGARQADYVLNVVRSVMNWHASRTDDFNPPIVRGMRRQSPHAQQRSRVLDDGELRAIWKAAENAGVFGAAVRLCLLTGQRRAKILRMRWSDIGDDGTWSIPREPREKDSAGAIALPEPALAIIRSQPRFAGNPYVLAGRSAGPINGISKFKARLDRAAGVTGWRLHDLRRTARSLMSRAGITSEHAERVMGHAIGGVEGIYDRHSYAAEKADALARLANLIGDIVNSRDKVITLTAERAKRR